MLVWTSNPEVTPAPEVGVILYPNFFGGLFFEEVEGQRSKLGVILLRSIPLLSQALRDPTAPGRRAPSRFAPFFSPQTPEGAWFGIVSDSQRF